MDMNAFPRWCTYKAVREVISECDLSALVLYFAITHCLFANGISSHRQRCTLVLKEHSRAVVLQLRVAGMVKAVA
jgi:hypothetical protein